MDFAKFKKNRSKMVEAVKKVKDQKPNYVDERFWTTTPDKQGNADAIIRFLPQPDPEEPFAVMKFIHGFNEKGKWFIENCPQTIGEECPSDEYAQPFWDEGTKESKAIASKFTKKRSYIANILVVNDLSKPDNNGKVFLWRFGVKIFEKIMDKLAPKSELDEQLLIYDLWEGRNFKLKQRKVDDYPNYDLCEFVDSNSAVADTEKGIEEIFKQIRDLGEFIDPKEFKKYGDLKKKFISVVGKRAAEFFSDSNEGDTGKEVNTKSSSKIKKEDFETIDESEFDDTANDDEKVVKENTEEDDEAVKENTEEDVDFDFDEDDFKWDDDDDDVDVDEDDDIPL